MLSPYLYYTAYLVLLVILTAIISHHYSLYSDSRLSENFRQNSLPAFVLALGLSIWIGLRPVSYAFVDMIMYDIDYNRHMLNDEFFEFNWNIDNALFQNLQNYMAFNEYESKWFYLIIANIYFIGMFVAFRKMLPKDTMYMLLIYLAAFSTFSYGTNGLKAGAAASLMLCALAYKDKLWLMIIFLLLSLGFHHSMTLPIAAVILSLCYKNTKNYYIVWCVCLLIALCHITFFQNIFNSYADERGQEYLSTVNGKTSHGFRIDFIFYSAFPLIVGYYAIFKHHYESKFYSFLLNTYITINSVWMLCMYAEFTNRIAYLSWQLLPVVLVYPFFDKKFVKNQYQKLNLVAWLHLGFTITMQVAYYGFFK